MTTTSNSLVRNAKTGDETAWQALVSRYAPLVWAVTRAHRLRGADAADAAQNTWTALAEHLSALRRPDRLPGWLTTTARRECLRILLQGRRELPLDGVDPPGRERPDATVLEADRDRLLWAAFAELPTRCRKLLGLLAHAPELTYVQVSRALGLQVGSIGRTRGRCVAELRHRLVALGGGPE